MSVLESRCVTLDEEELRSAVANCARVANALHLPDQPLDSIDFLPAEGAVTFTAGSDRVKIAAEGLVALLVADCARLGIPLPRNGAKSLHVLPDGVSMTIDIRTQAARRVSPSVERSEERFPRAMVWPISREVLSV